MEKAEGGFHVLPRSPMKVEYCEEDDTLHLTLVPGGQLRTEGVDNHDDGYAVTVGSDGVGRVVTVTVIRVSKLLGGTGGTAS